jgi:hypothetical protein
MAREITLGDFLKLLVAALQRQNIQMPFQNDRPWHLLFYSLKRNAQVADAIPFLKDLWFDWNGPYPKSKELTEFLQALHWTASFGVVNPHYDVIVIPEEVATSWSKGEEDLDPQEKELLDEAVKRADVAFREASPGVYAAA